MNFAKFLRALLFTERLRWLLYLTMLQRLPHVHADVSKSQVIHRCFPVNFAKVLRTPFFTEHLRWLLYLTMLQRLPHVHVDVSKSIFSIGQSFSILQSQTCPVNLWKLILVGVLSKLSAVSASEN